MYMYVQNGNFFFSPVWTFPWSNRKSPLRPRLCGAAEISAVFGTSPPPLAAVLATFPPLKITTLVRKSSEKCCGFFLGFPTVPFLTTLLRSVYRVYWVSLKQADCFILYKGMTIKGSSFMLRYLKGGSDVRLYSALPVCVDMVSLRKSDIDVCNWFLSYMN